jgi:hypothetical protein
MSKRRLLLVFLGLILGCDHPAPSSGGAEPASDSAPPGTASGGSAAARPSPATSASHGKVESHVAFPCRVIGLEGSVTSQPLGAAPGDAGALLIQSGLSLPDNVWVDVGKASRLTTRDATSTREVNYVGPGRFYACIEHKEEAWVERGVFESVGGAGERPGGEQWVVTPFGAARYDVAKWKITVKDKSVEIRTASGGGFFWPAEGTKLQAFSEAGSPPSVNGEGWIPLEATSVATVSADKLVLTPEAATTALDQCTHAAADAKNIATSLAQPGANVGELGSKHVIARRLAHAACNVAHLRIESLPPSPARDDLLGRVQTAEADWKFIGLVIPPTPSP